MLLTLLDSSIPQSVKLIKAVIVAEILEYLAKLRWSQFVEFQKATVRSIKPTARAPNWTYDGLDCTGAKVVHESPQLPTTIQLCDLRGQEVALVRIRCNLEGETWILTHSRNLPLQACDFKLFLWKHRIVPGYQGPLVSSFTSDLNPHFGRLTPCRKRPVSCHALFL